MPAVLAVKRLFPDKRLVIAFNADLPYDQLVREHIAGDLLETPRYNRRDEINESILGPAHFRMVEHAYLPLDPLEDRVKYTDNQIDVFSTVLLWRKPSGFP